MNEPIAQPPRVCPDLGTAISEVEFAHRELRAAIARMDLAVAVLEATAALEKAKGKK